MTAKRTSPAAPADAEPSVDQAMRQYVGYTVKRAYMVIQPAVQEAIAPFGLRIPSFSCLSVIVANPGIAPSVLAETLKMERSNIVLVVDELETAELISRTQMKTDRRRHALTATMRGKQVHKKAAAAVEEAEMRLTAGFDDAEREQLIALLARIEGSR